MLDLFKKYIGRTEQLFRKKHRLAEEKRSAYSKYQSVWNNIREEEMILLRRYREKEKRSAELTRKVKKETAGKN